MLCLRRLMVTFGLFSCLASGLLAQTDTATITGVIVDASAALVPRAAVEAVNRDTGLNYRAESNESGVYVLTALPIGRYDVAVTAQGFQTTRRPNIVLSAGTRARVDFALKLGAVSEVVEVTAEVPLLESETSALGQVVENKTITQMPLNGRNYQKLATLAPGVLPSRSRNFVDDAFSVNGANMWQNQFVLDGADNTNYFTGVVIASNQVVKPSIDAIHEFKMETHNFSAEFGRGGGAVIQVTTRSGTNELHGTLFEFLRNDKLDANNFFNSGRAKPPFRQNQFGGTFGGPVVRDRMFFFGSDQATYVREQLTRLSRIPTPQMRAGNFAGLAAIHDPATQNAAGTRDPFPGNVIPGSRFDPVAIRMIQLYPEPNRAGVQNFVFNTPRNLDDHQIDSRFDWRVKDRDNLFLRYSFHDYERLEPGTLPLPGSGGDTALRLSRAQAGALNWTHSFASGRMVNEARLAYSRLTGGIDTPTREPLWKQFGFKGTYDREDIRGLPVFSITSYASLGDRSFAPDPRKMDIRQFVESFSWTVGKHALKMGGNIRQFIQWTGITNLARGQFGFNGQFTGRDAGRTLGDALADTFLGLTNTTRLSTPLDIRQPSFAYEAYLQDNYKVSRRLTLNLGVRYEFQTPYIEQNNRVQNFVVDPAKPDYGKLVPVRGSSIEERSFQKPDYNNFAPRIGFAWQVNDHTVLRGGYGIFYDAVSQLPYGSRPAQNPPYYLQVDIATPNASAASAVRVRDGFPPDALNPNVLEGRSIAAVWPYSFADGITHQWNLNVQRNLPGNSVVSAAYVGTNTAHRRLGALSMNQPKPGPGALNPRRLFPNYSDVSMDVPLGTANYQGLELKFERRFTRGFSILTGYTWSHAMIGDIGQDNTVWAPEKGLSPEDLRHRFFLASVWDVPVGRGRRWLGGGILGSLTGGWQISPIFTAQTGLPYTPGVAGNPANTTGGIRPDRLRDGNLPPSERRPERWFDVQAFAVPAPFRFGNTGSNILQGPGLVNLDLMVGRTFRLSERCRLDFRSEFFNLLNEAHFLFPAATINAANAGAISQTVDAARQIQFGLKLVF
ncbi:MAG: TonB-dependent receptor [Acidobacteria bacterium]|nr:TonB-dependent receptor [Acidobacteriota bacterium]